jgi:hypothetical protein
MENRRSKQVARRKFPGEEDPAAGSVETAKSSWKKSLKMLEKKD